MPNLDSVYEHLPRYLPVIIIAFVVFVALRLIRWLWLEKKFDTFCDHKIVPQILMLGLNLVGLVLIVLALPISDNLRGQILSLFGLLLTGVMALSSATFVSNLFGGSMLRLTRSFRIGDYIKVGEKFGRVSERGLFHTEIQTVDRDLTTFPNLYLITNPVTVVHKSGTIISATISLGYDISHTRIERLLNLAAEKTGLDDPYVHVMELGDFSISYKVCGFLEVTKNIITARSDLNKSILDTLHADGVEIVSPSFMNQRVQKEGVTFIPDAKVTQPAKRKEEKKAAEEIVFDKAEEAAAQASEEKEKSKEDNPEV
ncbi:MAG: mechanosensitive ion channel [Opitutales bacterium]|nr:mechanosensitive ion channel [Opitutales bacterium]